MGATTYDYRKHQDLGHTNDHDSPKPGAAMYAWAVTRISLGAIFLWAFLDKTFGLGYATAAEKAWIAGGSPTLGFLKFGTSGPFASTFQAMAGSVFVDWLFMLGLLGIGLALILGIGMRVAAVSGVLMMLLMWSAALPKTNHPFLDDHIVYAAVLVGLALTNAGNTWGFGKAWSRMDLVRRYPALR